MDDPRPSGSINEPRKDGSCSVASGGSPIGLSSLPASWQGCPFWPVVRKFVHYIPVLALLGSFASLLEGIGIGMLIPLLALAFADTVPEGVPAPLRLIAAAAAHFGPDARILALGGAICALILVKTVVQGATSALIGRINAGIDHRIRQSLAQRLLSFDYPFFLTVDRARLIKVTGLDCWKVADSARAALSMVPAATSLAVFAALLAWLDWRLFGIVVAGGLLLAGLLQLLHQHQRTLSRGSIESHRLLTARTLSIIGAARVIRLFGQEERERNRFNEAAQGVRRRTIAELDLAAINAAAGESMIGLIFVAVLLAALALSISLPEVIGFLVLLLRLQPNAQAIHRARTIMASEWGSAAEVGWLLREAPAAVGERSAVPVPDAFDQPITFEDVTYSYPSGPTGLADVSLTLSPGVATALIGESGSGKSTIVSLLARLIEPQTGVIRLGKERIDAFKASRWRERLAIAGQDLELVAGTVAENIAYGCPEASVADIEEAARSAGAADFIARLPQGLKTMVGHEGLSLSGGQRQRIGLARALLRRPELLILDEATNAVDALAENEIFNVLSEAKFYRTALVISHRRSTLALCQDGIVMGAGRVLEAGPLRELKYYRAMTGEAG